MVDDVETEKQNPGDKLWLIIKHMSNDKDYNCSPNFGFQLDIGDTIKFGRVRYKIIMFHNRGCGFKTYDILDRFKGSETDRKLSARKNKRKVKKEPSNRNVVSGLSSERIQNVANLPRF